MDIVEEVAITEMGDEVTVMEGTSSHPVSYTHLSRVCISPTMLACVPSARIASYTFNAAAFIALYAAQQ